MPRRLFLLVLLTFAATRTASATVPFEVVGIQLGKELGRANFFVVVKVKGVPNEQAKEDCLAIARKLCKGTAICLVSFWPDKAKAARKIPMTDAQADAQIASYLKNEYQRLDGFVCHPFGPGDEHCTTSRDWKHR